MFIGRDHELEKLERIYKYNGNGLAIVLVGGNKGIGKTTLVEEFCKKKEHIFFMATQERARTNLQKFSLMVREHYGDYSRDAFGVWSQAFEFIRSESKGNRTIVVIDDFENLCERDSLFTRSLQGFAERELLKANIMLILLVPSEVYARLTKYTEPISRSFTAKIKLDTVAEEDIKKLTMNIDQARILRYQADDVLLREGEESNDMYKILSGRVICYFNYEKKNEIVLGSLKQNNTFGEYSLLTGNPAIYTVVAYSEVLLLRISRSELEKFIALNATNALEIMTNMAKMLNIMKASIGMLSSETVEGFGKEQVFVRSNIKNVPNNPANDNNNENNQNNIQGDGLMTDSLLNGLLGM